MSKLSWRKIKCNKCGIEFDAPVYESVNVTLDPDLREKVLNGEIFVFECPVCHEKHFIQYPFLYHDMKNKFMIQQGNPADLISYEHNFVKGNSEEINKDFIGFLDNYKQLGATSYKDFLSKIIMLENGLDYRIATLLELVVKSQFEYWQEQNNDFSVKVVDTFYQYNKNKEVVITLELESQENQEKHHFVDIKFNKETYDEINEKFGSEIENVYSYFFDHNVASKFLFRDEKVASRDKKIDIELITISLPEGDSLIAFTPAFNIGKYSVGDAVIAMKDKSIAKGKVSGVYRMNKFYSPFNPDWMPVVAWPAKPVKLVATADSNSNIGNGILINDLRSHKEGMDFNDLELAKADAIVLLDATLKDNDIKPEDLKVGDVITGDQIKLSLITKEIDDHNLLSVYLNESYIKDEHSSKAIYNFEELVKLVINNPEKYSGIVINPDTDNMVLGIPYLINHRLNLLLRNQSKMRKVFMTLSKKEKDYLTKYNYELLTKIYFKNLSTESVSKELSKDIKTVKKEIGEALRLLGHIVIDNYQFDI